ncbi:BTB domain-containing protein [Mycena sanguinolenta]|uniref:BTB domain-containing protein n=1 Tax=Mycena sanguinolenta TaxID=230812 RepID=A0A8H6XZD4_9AGAR|nr:BTB domain-containing protein [Mycena sanguinolenta]
MSSPPAKRKRTETMSITRSEIWYKDGSVVLQAENTQFRVYWGILSQHSPFFRDLENLPQPPNQPTVDGCSVVELHDSAEDVEYLLKALYDPHFLSQTTLPLAAVGALIRLGRKYDFQTLFESARARITFETPTTLEEYDALIPDGGTYKPTRITSYPGFTLDLLTLVRENNILSALPVAYYHASRSRPGTLLDGIPRTDGTLALLAPVDLRLCLTGRERLLCQQFKEEHTMGCFVASQVPGCGRPAKCRANRKCAFDRCVDENVVDSLYNLKGFSGWKKVFCAACY